MRIFKKRSNKQCSINKRRRGTLLFESLASVALLGSIICLVVPIFKSMHDGRRTADQRRVALMEISNLAERLALWPADQLTSEAIKKLELSPECRQSLGQAELEVVATPQSNPIGIVKVDLTLKWQSAMSSKNSSVGLSAWLLPVKKQSKGNP